MKCQVHQETLVDIARGVAVPAAVVEAAEAHMADCARCRADLARERELSAGLQALAVSAEELAPPAALEARLLKAFDALAEARAGSLGAETGDARAGSLHATAGSGPVAVPAPWRTYGRALAAAASIVLVAGIALSRLEVTADRPSPPAEPVRLLPAGPVAASLTSVAIEALSNELSRSAAASSPDAERVIVFQPIPGAGTLPAFESARILRTEMPVEALPAYGVEIVPDAVRKRVVLDLLVGQDGFARGVRLVSGAH